MRKRGDSTSNATAELDTAEDASLPPPAVKESTATAEEQNQYNDYHDRRCVHVVTTFSKLDRKLGLSMLYILGTPDCSSKASRARKSPSSG